MTNNRGGARVPERPRNKAELEGRRSPPELRGWRDKAQLKAQKSMVQAE